MGETMSGRPLTGDRRRIVTAPSSSAAAMRGPALLTGAREPAVLGRNFTLQVFPGQEHAIDPKLLAPALTAFPAAAG
ncbi:hypothetical protein [Streptomyces sp. t39]|uniref:hypothetical protein n=1 Tax=Streptomyces sp. t39 TaxID=1828156 RepID=UPI0011CD6CD0|nr:hypothetical protein [Streptomyces sp. t39]TXS49873.1 hypothetical protein EAO77_28640 [Streptomyces sp. t39]